MNKQADHTDHHYQKQRDLKASEANGILRSTPPPAIHWAVDPNGETLYLHNSTALVDAYGTDVVEKIYDDIKFFLSLHPPNLPDPQRHFNDERILKAHPEFAKENGGSSGVVHYGCWHERGKEFADAPLLLKTSDSRPSADTKEGFLKQLLRNACAHITRVVALLFGIASPEMRDQYRRVVESIADYRRMDTIEEELWTLRAVLNNVMTESHQDSNELDRWTGAGDMCLRQLGIHLASPSGAVTGILGRETIHNITEWTDFDSKMERRSRISVVHTTHESIRQEALQNLAKQKKRSSPEPLGTSEEEKPRKRQPHDTSSDTYMGRVMSRL
ncbi:hypothetical protein HO173_009538 [Letharia columbiana]|uniref:Uncharacterized protein n=1 Tax=Letharia columbiana TaxID=112416 RepID=A0A8H6FP49_9LECA|nr:uncharacterized protein HO173_009538 [Letharia columbiana]KAF6232155.1 hypothetical protein HO173_009538 [Letharia columbiana]